MWINNINKIDYLALRGIQPTDTDSYGAYYTKTKQLCLLLDRYDIEHYYIRNRMGC